MGSSSPSSPSRPWGLSKDPHVLHKDLWKKPNRATGTVETLCWLLEPFWRRDEGSNYEKTLKTRKKRLIRQSQVCTGGLSMEKLPFIRPPPSAAAHSSPHATGRGTNTGVSSAQRGEKHRAAQTHPQRGTNTPQLSVLTASDCEKPSSGSKMVQRAAPLSSMPACRARHSQSTKAGDTGPALPWHQALPEPGFIIISERIQP